jgi:hypothetical protein
MGAQLLTTDPKELCELVKKYGTPEAATRAEAVFDAMENGVLSRKKARATLRLELQNAVKAR